MQRHCMQQQRKGIKVSRWLLANGAQINAAVVRTILRYCAALGQNDVVVFLVSHGADVRLGASTLGDGVTPLYEAAMGPPGRG
jgi:hypothetical protein